MPEYIKNEAGLAIRQWAHRQTPEQRMRVYALKQVAERYELLQTFEEENAVNHHLHHQRMVARLVKGVQNVTKREASPVDDGWY